MTGILKQAICDALATFIRSRPGFDPHNYGDAASYRADVRRAARQKRDAETMLAAVRWRDSITGADLIEAARGAFSGRLTIELLPAGQTVRGLFLPSPIPDAPSRVRIDYCVGQYGPTEYRAAVCAVLAGALWNWQRDNMPPLVRHRVECLADTNADGSPGGYVPATRREFPTAADAETYAQTVNARRYPFVHAVYGDQHMCAGDWLRRKFRAEFGSALQRRWFD